jgi:WD40 repeat protein
MLNIRHLHTCTGHRSAIYALAIGCDTRHVLSAGGDGWIVEWNLDAPENGVVIASVETQLYSLCSLPERDLIVAGNMNGGVHWIDRKTPDRVRNVQHHQKGVFDLLSVGDWLFSVGGDGMLTRWSLDTGRTVESYQLSSQSLRALSYDLHRNELAVGASDKSIYLLDAGTLKLRRTISDAHGSSVFTVAYSPDGRYLLSGGRDAMLRIRDLDANDAIVFEEPAHWFTINHLAFSPDGLFFATASRDKTFKIWDARSFELLKVVDTIRHGNHINSVNRLLWLQDTLASCSDDRTLMLWSVEES